MNKLTLATMCFMPSFIYLCSGFFGEDYRVKVLKTAIIMTIAGAVLSLSTVIRMTYETLDSSKHDMLIQAGFSLFITVAVLSGLLFLDDFYKDSNTQKSILIFGFITFVNLTNLSVLFRKYSLGQLTTKEADNE